MQRVDSQAILSERRGLSEGGLPGSARRAGQDAAAALSRTRTIVPGGECLCGEPPHLEQADQLRELRLHTSPQASNQLNTDYPNKKSHYNYIIMCI